MKLYHYVQDDDAESIERNGLRFPDKREPYSDTAEINHYLNQHRPSDLPAFINRNKCIFFWPYVRYQKIMPNKQIACVESSELEQGLLYVFNNRFAHAIWTNVVDGPYSGKKSGYTNKLAAEYYWQSGVKLKDAKLPIEEAELKHYEVLYFGEIKPQLLTITCRGVEEWSRQN